MIYQFLQAWSEILSMWGKAATVMNFLRLFFEKKSIVSNIFVFTVGRPPFGVR